MRTRLSSGDELILVSDQGHRVPAEQFKQKWVAAFQPPAEFGGGIQRGIDRPAELFFRGLQGGIDLLESQRVGNQQ
jgi:hypothetical protein